MEKSPSYKFFFHTHFKYNIIIIIIIILYFKLLIYKKIITINNYYYIIKHIEHKYIL